MSEPKRWSSPGSEVDPVVRALMGYAQSRAPGEEQVQRLVVAARARAAKRSRVVPWRARARLVAGVAAGMALAGLGWGAVSRWVVPRSPAPVAPVVPAVKGGAAPLRETRGAEAPPTLPSAAPLTPPSDSARPALRAPKSAPADPLGALVEARRALVQAPARALALTEADARENPKSAFAEERAAIAIEALARLGRRGEATRQFTEFERRYPESPYRRRLRARLAPSR